MLKENLLGTEPLFEMISSYLEIVIEGGMTSSSWIEIASTVSLFLLGYHYWVKEIYCSPPPTVLAHYGEQTEQHWDKSHGD